MNIGPDVARALAQGARRAAPALVPTLAGPGAEASVDGGADAPARGKFPILRGKSGSRGTRADQGVRPTDAVTSGAVVWFTRSTR